MSGPTCTDDGGGPDPDRRLDAYAALKVISEIGTDMTKWESAGHFASWLGLSPNNRVTGGKVISSKTKPSASRAAAALRLAANALHRSVSALGAFLRRKKAQLGECCQGRRENMPLGRSKTVPPGWCLTAPAWTVGWGPPP